MLFERYRGTYKYSDLSKRQLIALIVVNERMLCLIRRRKGRKSTSRNRQARNIADSLKSVNPNIDSDVIFTIMRSYLTITYNNRFNPQARKKIWISDHLAIKILIALLQCFTNDELVDLLRYTDIYTDLKRNRRAVIQRKSKLKMRHGPLYKEFILINDLKRQIYKHQSRRTICRITE